MLYYVLYFNLCVNSQIDGFLKFFVFERNSFSNTGCDSSHSARQLIIFL